MVGSFCNKAARNRHLPLMWTFGLYDTPLHVLIAYNLQLEYLIYCKENRTLRCLGLAYS